MKRSLSSALDRISDFFSQRKGLLPMLGILFVLLNFGLHLLGESWFTEMDLFLHAGIVLAVLGYMLAWAL